MTESVTSPGTLPFEEPERWLPVPDYEGLYEVSDLGRVRSLPRLSKRRNRVYGGNVLKPYVSRHTRGYQVVALCRDSEQDNRLVHQLVAEAFIGRCPPGQEVLHGSNGKMDNRLSEIRYGTRSENINDRVRDGQDNRGEKAWTAKLTWEAVADIRSRVASGYPQCALADEYDVSRQAICFVVAGRTWRYPPSD
jgi:hypothetical protein